MKLSVDIRKKLRDFDLNVKFTAHDEVFALLGASGCGKSFTLKCIAGIETPDVGRIVLNGRVLFDSDAGINLPPQKRRVGYLFQNYALFPNMTVAENILFAAVRDDQGRRLKEYLQQFQLVGLERAYPHELSGGQQQRVAFVRILVSHDKGEVYRLADRIAVMNAGQIDVVDRTRELFADPKTLAATLLIGCKNISAAKKIDDTHLFAEDWQMTLRASKKIPDGLRFVGIHAENVVDAAGDNVFRATTVQVSEDFNVTIVMAKVSDTATTIRLDVDKGFHPPAEFFLRLPPDKLILLER